MDFLVVAGMAILVVGGLFLSQGLYWAMVAKRERDQQEMLRRLNMAADTGTSSLFRERAADAVAQALGGLGQHLQQTLEGADSTWQVSNLLGYMSGLLVIGSIGGLIFVGPTGVIIGFVLGVLPYFWVRRQGQQRIRRLLEQLPDCLDLMARSLQAGISLAESFRMVAEEMPMPAAGEFGRVFEEVRLGREYREALNTLIVRNPELFDLRLFVSSVLLSRETGGNMIEVLDNISTTIRQRFLFHAKVKAMTSEARFSAYILGGLPLMIGLILFVMKPDYLLPLVEDPLGNLFLLYFFSSYALGTFVMGQVSKVEV